MLNKLRLERFKNFKNAELILGPLTLLVGTNASGKSNIRAAFRFLHGISRGYKLAEIIGEKYVERGLNFLQISQLGIKHMSLVVQLEEWQKLLYRLLVQCGFWI